MARLYKAVSASDTIDSWQTGRVILTHVDSTTFKYACWMISTDSIAALNADLKAF